MPIITEEKKGARPSGRKSPRRSSPRRAERDLSRRELVKIRMHLQRLQVELETTRYKQEMKARLAGSVAILVVACAGVTDRGTLEISPGAAPGTPIRKRYSCPREANTGS